MSNGFTKGKFTPDLKRPNGHCGIAIERDDQTLVATVYLSVMEAPEPVGGNIAQSENAEAVATAELFAASLNASTTLATMGYDAVECQKALPELVALLAGVSEDGGMHYYVPETDALLSRLRVQEVDNG